jgi:hypothetical protein
LRRPRLSSFEPPRYTRLRRSKKAEPPGLEPCVLGFISGIYGAWQFESWGFAIYVAILAALFGWLAFIYLRKQRNVIELTDSAITWRRASLVTVILWSEVVGFNEAPSSTAWLVRARDGRTLRVDKLLVVVPTTFVDYLRKYLPPQLFDTALFCVRPKAALRMTVPALPFQLRPGRPDDALAILEAQRSAIRQTAASAYSPAIIDEWAPAVIVRERVDTFRRSESHTSPMVQ